MPAGCGAKIRYTDEFEFEKESIARCLMKVTVMKLVDGQRLLADLPARWS